jgi:hypothetical protein
LALLPTKRIVATSSTKIAASITAYSGDVLDFVVPQFQGEAKHVFLAGVFSLRRESG